MKFKKKIDENLFFRTSLEFPYSENGKLEVHLQKNTRYGALGFLASAGYDSEKERSETFIGIVAISRLRE